MSQELNAPAGTCALDDPRTREALEQLPRYFWVRFAKKMMLWAPIGLASWLVAWIANITWMLYPAMIAAFAGVMIASQLIGSYRWLARIKRVLSVYPWKNQARVKPGKGGVTRRKASFALWLGMPNGKLSAEMLARHVLDQSTFVTDTHKGVWFAGDYAFGGVISRPLHADDTAFVWARNSKETASEREAASPERHELAKRAGIHSLYM